MRFQVQVRGLLESNAKKQDLQASGDNVMVPLTDLDSTKIAAHILHAVILEAYSNGQFKLGTRHILTIVWNKISKITTNSDK